MSSKTMGTPFWSLERTNPRPEAPLQAGVTDPGTAVPAPLNLRERSRKKTETRVPLISQRRQRIEAVVPFKAGSRPLCGAVRFAPPTPIQEALRAQ